MSDSLNTTRQAGSPSAFRPLARSRTSPIGNTARREALIRRPDPIPRVEVVQLAPILLDEEQNEVPGSTDPQAIPYKHPMVKVKPEINRIAHRELKVRIWSPGRADHFHAGKSVTWTMAPLFVRLTTASGKAAAPEFRGDWHLAAAEHRDRFEAPAEFDSSEFTRVGQECAKTVVDATGHTALRVNLPPIAFNAARVSAQVEGESAAVAVVDLEVPGIIVIDPGHGGHDDMRSSTANNATSHTSRVLEKDLALDFGLRTRSALWASRTGENQNIRVHMTRTEDVNLPGSQRAKVARDNGADIFLSIHFNGFNGSVRGTEALVRRSSDNVNFDQDRLLAGRVSQAVYQAILAHDDGAAERGVKEQQLAALSDPALGNTAQYHPLRSALIEVEFIDNEAVDALLSINEGHQRVRQDIADAIAGALIDDLRESP